MKNIKNNKAITLIALVITIIILLILAGIVIATLFGESGIINQAKNAKDNSVVGLEKEKIELAYMSAVTKNLGKTVTDQNLQDELDLSEGRNKTKVTPKSESIFNVLFIDTNNNYKVDNGKVSKIDDGGNVVIADEDAGIFDYTTGELIKSWTDLVNDGTIRISNGKINSGLIYDGSNYKLVIPSSITSVGGYSFDECDPLRSVFIPSSVTSIENGAFEMCHNLTDLTLSNGLVSIGEDAFQYCSVLTNINIPDTVTSIGTHAFRKCDSFTSITIPKGVIQIGYNPFAGCASLTTMVVEDDNTIYDSRENCNAIIETNTNKLIAIVKGTNIPYSVTKIGEYAFEMNAPSTEITIPTTITSIGDFAYYSTSITSVMIPSSVTHIGINPFAQCSSLNAISVDGENTVYDSRENCNAIIETSTNKLIAGSINTTILAGVSEICDYAFYRCLLNWSLTSTTIPSSVIRIGDYAFYNTHISGGLVIPSGVTEIGNDAFERNDYLRTITISSTVTRIGNYAFYSCGNVNSLSIQNGVKEIGKLAFASMSGIRTLNIPSSVLSIGERAFSGCRNLTITINKAQDSISGSPWGANNTCTITWNGS